MSDAFFLFSRQIAVGDEEYAQTVTVFAPDIREAQRVLEDDLKRLRDDLASAEADPALAVSPAWQVSEVLLDGPRVVTFAITQ